MIGIIDYGMGNLRSVQKAFESVGAQARILQSRDQMASVERLVLPGVGAFADGMSHLRQMGWIEPLRQFVESRRPFLGICLGMQLLFDGSEEDAASGERVPGLGLLAGAVVQFVQPPADQRRIKIPHMGWNELRVEQPDPLLAQLPAGAAVYFVHSYYCRPLDPRVVIATAEYPAGRPFCAAIRHGNIWATQFHPEKSQRVGLCMLANFARLESP